MGSTTVTDALFMGNVTANAMDNGRKNQVEGTAFAKAMSDVSSPSVTTANDVVKTTTTVEKSSRNPIKNADSKQTGAGEDVKNGNVPDDKTVDKIADKVAEKINAVNDEIKKNLDVTDEEIAVAMQSMGMLPQDLLNPDALKNLMMELSQVEDSMALLTDENLYQGMQNVLKTAELAVADIKADFSIDDETFAKISKIAVSSSFNYQKNLKSKNHSITEAFQDSNTELTMTFQIKDRKEKESLFLRRDINL